MIGFFPHTWLVTSIPCYPAYTSHKLHGAICVQDYEALAPGLLYLLHRYNRQLLLGFIFPMTIRYPLVLSSTRLYVGSSDHSCVPELYRPVMEELKNVGVLGEGLPSDK